MDIPEMCWRVAPQRGQPIEFVQAKIKVRRPRPAPRPGRRAPRRSWLPPPLPCHMRAVLDPDQTAVVRRADHITEPPGGIVGLLRVVQLPEPRACVVWTCGHVSVWISCHVDMRHCRYAVSAQVGD